MGQKGKYLELRGSPTLNLGASVLSNNTAGATEASMAYKDKATKGSNPSETKVWVNPWQVVGTTEMLAKGKRNLDGAAAEGNDKYQLEVKIQTTPRDHFSPIR